jgi:hypothetical protein
VVQETFSNYSTLQLSFRIIVFEKGGGQNVDKSFLEFCHQMVHGFFFGELCHEEDTCITH